MHKFAAWQQEKIMNTSTKSLLQAREFGALKDKHRVILKWATGCGKSKMALDLIKNACKNKPQANILFVVAEIAHIQNWRSEMTKWQFNGYNITIICYASLRKVENNSYDVIVLDEVHHAFSPRRLGFIETLKADYIYLLSATMSEAKLEIMEDVFGKFTTSTVTLKDAIKEDILSDPQVYVIGMELDNTAIKEEIVIGKSTSYPIVKWEDRMRYIYNNNPCKIKCTEYQKYLYFTQSMDYWKERYQRSSNPFHHNMWVNMGSFRKRYLGEKKTRIIRGLINFIPRNRRYVCFCASVGQANSLNAKNTISSKRSPKLNQQIIDYFNSKLINQIFAVGMITEGMNLTDIEIGIIVQLDGKERLFIQKFGRSMRAKNPITFIFYYKNTQDEVYLKHALENIDEKFIHHININQLKTIKV